MSIIQSSLESRGIYCIVTYPDGTVEEIDEGYRGMVDCPGEEKVRGFCYDVGVEKCIQGETDAFSGALFMLANWSGDYYQECIFNVVHVSV